MNYHNNRIVTVDVIRGFALMGLFLVHVIEYYELYWLHYGPLEWLWRALTWLNFKLPFKLRPVYA